MFPYVSPFSGTNPSLVQGIQRESPSIAPIQQHIETYSQHPMVSLPPTPTTSHGSNLNSSQDIPTTPPTKVKNWSPQPSILH